MDTQKIQRGFASTAQCKQNFQSRSKMFIHNKQEIRDPRSQIITARTSLKYSKH